MFNLKDKKVLIVGATGGIGSALTKTFAEAGAILGLATRDEEALNKLSSELSVKNYKYIVDLSDLKGLEEFIEKADQEMGGIDIMLCNAGITKDSLSMKMKTEDFQKVIDINLTSTFILNRGTSKLCCFKSWYDWYDKINSIRICFKRHHNQLHFPRFH